MLICLQSTKKKGKKEKLLKKNKLQKRIKMKSKLIQKMKQLKKQNKKEKKHIKELLLKDQIRCKQLAAQLALMATEFRKLTRETQKMYQKVHSAIV